MWNTFRPVAWDYGSVAAQSFTGMLGSLRDGRQVQPCCRKGEAFIENVERVTTAQPDVA